MSDLSLQYRKPVTLGVAGPGVTWEQAEARIDEYAERSVTAAVSMVLAQKQLKETRQDASHTMVVE